MKRNFLNRAIEAVVGIAFLLCLFAPFNSEAGKRYFPYPPYMSEKECVVVHDGWEDYSPKGFLKMPVAIDHANMPSTATVKACRNKISLMANPAMKGPLRIYPGAGGEFTIQGGCVEMGEAGVCTKYEGVSVFNASSIKDDGSGRKCVIDISPNPKATNRVMPNRITIKDISIENMPTDWKGICINGNDNILDNVAIDGAVEGDGIVIEDGAGGNQIMPNVSLRNLLRGIIIENAAPTSNNFIQLSNTIGEINNYGYAPVPEEGAMTITQVADPKQWVASMVPYEVKLTHKLLTKANGTDYDYVDLYGKVVDTSSGNQCGVALKDIKHILIFSTGSSSAGADDEKDDGRLVGYLLPREYGESSSSRGFNLKTGQFRLRLPTTLSSVVFVPVVSNGMLGNSSGMIGLNDDPSDDVECPKTTDEEDPNNWLTGGNVKRMRGLSHCCELRFPGDINACMSGQAGNGDELPHDELWDTDGDGKSDDEEDLNLNCRVDDGETSYYNPDTDNDGIPDGTTLERKMSKREVNGVEIDVLNALIDDVDGDGLLDGQEDRNQNFSFGVGAFRSKNYLFNISVNSTFSINNAVKDESGKPVACDLNPGNEQMLGVGYDLYNSYCSDATCSKVLGVPERGANFMAVSAEEATLADSNGVEYKKTIHVYACCNVSLGAKENFNGVREPGNYELNPESDDTDGDSFKDKDDDLCPLFNTIENTVEACKGETRCTDTRVKDILWGIDPQYVTTNANTGMPTGYVMDGTQPLFFTDVMNHTGDKRLFLREICQGDMDGDGIPDCVEQPSMTCPGADQLKYWESDSDGDNIEDLLDVCPESRGARSQHAYDPTKDPKKDYGCDVYAELYTKNPLHKIRAFIWDRDLDRLYDYEEDLDLNGDGSMLSKFSADGKLVSMTEEDVNAMETNPMLADTDGDGIEDFTEKRVAVRDIYYTNPRNPDTDGDGLIDGKEDRDGDSYFTNVTTMVIGSESCVGAMKLDTDPTNPDTDGDGLTDYQEVSGDIFVGSLFVNAIMDDNVWDTIGRIAVGSNPRSADSDGDGIPDGEEYNGSFVDWFGTNPCMWDSDNDGVKDIEEFEGCGLNPDTNCKATTAQNKGRDSDNDGLTDTCEATLGTDASLADSDNDGIWDGAEINLQMVIEEYKLSKDLRVFKGDSTNKPAFDCTYDADAGDSNPDIADTDGDGVSDGNEVAYGSDPRQWDTDGDCIPDGPMIVRNHLGEEVQSLGENKNADHKRDSNETDVTVMDTDGDGLPDGSFNGLGEDFNCNGQRDRNERGDWLETDPLNIDSDLDGVSDGEEIGGNMANLSMATTRNEGCSLSGSASGSPSSMFYLFGMMILAVKAAARRIRKTPA